MGKKKLRQFNVLIWNINKNTVEPYDVLPYFRDEYKRNKKNRPITKDEWEMFVRRWGKYMYWARCEYEIIVKSWPTQEGGVKIDIWEQIENNLDLIVELLMDEYGKKNVRSRRLVSSTVHSRKNSST